MHSPTEVVLLKEAICFQESHLSHIMRIATMWRWLQAQTLIRLHISTIYGSNPNQRTNTAQGLCFKLYKMRMMISYNKLVPLSHLGMFVTTGCSSRRQSVVTASRQDTSSRQQNTDSGRQVTASGQFYIPSQTQESKYGNYALLLLFRLKWKNGSTFNARNFM